MSLQREFRHPEFYGLALGLDPAGPFALVAENVCAPQRGQLDKRPGFRRVNHRRYAGAIVCVPDTQRICDYGHMLSITGFPNSEIYEHDAGSPDLVNGGLDNGTIQVNGHPSLGGNDPLFDEGWPLVVALSANPDNGASPLAVSFSPDGSFDPDGEPLTYLWDFGDGSPFSTAPHPVHVYSPPASTTFTATLTVATATGKSASGSVNIAVTVPPPPFVYVLWGGSGPGNWKAGP